jgi:hypothetical protein
MPFGREPIQLAEAIKTTEDMAIKDKLSRAGTQKPLTFGIEFEFVVEIRNAADAMNIFKEGAPKHNTEWALEMVKKYVADVLSRFVEHETSLDYNKATEKGVTDFSKWYITKDQTIERRESSKLYSYPIEVISPVLDFNEDSLGKIEKACEAITRKCNIDINNSCGLHVHIGNRGNNLEWTDVRKLVAVLWTLEPQIVQLHPTNRHIKFQCENIRGRYIDPKLADDTNAVSDPKPIIGKILKYEKLADLDFDHRLDGQSAYNLKKLQEKPPSKNAPKAKTISFAKEASAGKTIEFRQHRGTLNGDEAIAWLRLCAGLFTLAQRLDEKTLQELLEVWLDVLPNPDSLDYIIRNVICLPQVADYYRNREAIKDDNERTMPISIK